MTWLRFDRNKAFFQLPSPDFLASLAAGLVVGYTRLRPEWAPAQIPAIALFAWSLARATGIVGRLRPGFWFGAAMAALVLGNVGVPIPAAGILFVAMTAYWTALGAGLSHLLQRGGATGVLGAAGLITLGEWAQSEALPLFGTAQRFASAWVEYNAALPVSRASGTLGVTFITGIVALTVGSAFADKDIKRAIFRPAFAGMLLAPILFICGSIMLLAIRQIHEEPLPVKIAVCGSASADGAFMDETEFLKKYRPMIAKAAAKGAKLVVTPEMGLFVKDAERDATLARLAGEARQLGVAWVVGYAQSGPSLNRAVLLNADDGEHGRDARATKEGHAPVGESYDKTYWVPNIETYERHGDARAVTGTVDGVKVGLMICQDDNYEEVARNLSLTGVQVAAVPTFDWKGVENAHLQSARNRPRESGFVEARAAIGGISAIIDTTGRIVASRNHLTEGDGLVVASVELPSGGPSVFARYGNLPVLLFSGALVANALRRRKSGGGVPPPSP